jgi:hypothetical protein
VAGYRLEKHEEAAGGALGEDAFALGSAAFGMILLVGRSTDH